MDLTLVIICDMRIRTLKLLINVIKTINFY